MKISPSKLISLLFFIFSGFYLYTAHQIQVFAFDENAPFNAKTFPIYLGYAGMFFSGLKIVLPDQKPVEVNPMYLEFKKTILWTFQDIINLRLRVIIVNFLVFYHFCKIDFKFMKKKLDKI